MNRLLSKRNTVKLNQAYERLCRRDVALTGAFLWGFSQKVGFTKDTAEKPIGSAFTGSIIGIIFAFGIDLILPFMPPPAIGAIPILCGSSIVIQKVNELRYDDYNNTVSRVDMS